MATLTTKAAVLATAPELATVTEAEWTQALADVALEVPEDNLGDKAELAQRLWVAHTLAVKHPEMGTQQVQSVTMGGMSKTYAAAQPTTASEWGDTAYGRRLESLLAGTILAVGLA